VIVTVARLPTLLPRTPGNLGRRVREHEQFRRHVAVERDRPQVLIRLRVGQIDGVTGHVDTADASETKAQATTRPTRGLSNFNRTPGLSIGRVYTFGLRMPLATRNDKAPSTPGNETGCSVAVVRLCQIARFRLETPHREPSPARGKPRLRRLVGDLRGAPLRFASSPRYDFGACDAVSGLCCRARLRTVRLCCRFQPVSPSDLTKSNQAGVTNNKRLSSRLGAIGSCCAIEDSSVGSARSTLLERCQSNVSTQEHDSIAIE
jgi:hypothetical protein